MTMLQSKQRELAVSPATLATREEELDTDLLMAPEEFFTFLGKHATMRSNRALAFLTIFTLDQFDHASTLDEIYEDFKEFYNCRHPKTDFFQQLVHGYSDTTESLDTEIKKVLEHWDFSRISNSVKILLRMAMWELKVYKQTPFKTIIDEYVELSKLFAESDSFRIINGVLDKVGKEEKSIKPAKKELECQI